MEHQFLALLNTQEVSYLAAASAHLELWSSVPPPLGVRHWPPRFCHLQFAHLKTPQSSAAEGGQHSAAPSWLGCSEEQGHVGSALGKGLAPLMGPSSFFGKLFV